MVILLEVSFVDNGDNLLEWIGTLTRTTNLFDNNATREFGDTRGLGLCSCLGCENMHKQRH